MKVWELMLFQEGSFTETMLFAEDAPPSNQEMFDIVSEWRDGYKPEETQAMVQTACEPDDQKRAGRWSDLTLVLKEVRTK